jgi:hypothetical protein
VGRQSNKTNCTEHTLLKVQGFLRKCREMVMRDKMRKGGPERRNKRDERRKENKRKGWERRNVSIEER